MASLGPAVLRAATSMSSGSATSAWTLQSDCRQELCVSECSILEAERIVEDGAGQWGIANAPAVALRALQLIIGAPGGACIILAPDTELQRLAPFAHVSDGGGMTQRLKNVPVSSPEFLELFNEFAEHSSTDRWPADHRDALLRGRPKDGVGVLLSPSGFRVKCAVRLEGLPRSSRTWSCMGMRHNAALAATDVVSTAMVFVRSESAMVHVLIRSPSQLAAYSVSDACDSLDEHHDGAGAGEDFYRERLVSIDSGTHGTAEEVDFDRFEEEAGKLVMARQELDEKLARLRLECGDTPTPEVAAALHDLGVLCREGGDIVTARQHIEDSLALRRKRLGSDSHKEVADSLHELGLVFKEMRHLRMAGRCLKQSLRIKQALEVGDAREKEADVAVTRRELGAVCVERRRLLTAQEHLEDVLRAEDSLTGGGDSPDKARALRELGVLDMKSGNFHSAWSRLQEALTIERSLHGDAPHPDVARTLYSLGLVVLRSGDQTAARQHLEESLKISQALHGDTPHQETQRALRLLAALDARDGNYKSWWDHTRKSIDMHRAIHHTRGLSALPAQLDMMGLFLVERVLSVKSQCTSLDHIVSSALSLRGRKRGVTITGRSSKSDGAIDGIPSSSCGSSRSRGAATP